MLSRLIIAATLAASPAFAQSSNVQIPWRDIPASSCAVLIEQAFAGGSVLTLRCKGRIDVLLAHCTADRCTP